MRNEMITAVFLGFATVMLATPPTWAEPPEKAKPAEKTKPAEPAKPAEKAKADEKAKPADKKPEPTGAAAELIGKVQKYYDQTKDFRADFTQLYTRVALSKTSESSGKVAIKKPGMMRWEYEKPAKKLFVAVGKQLYVYEPEEEQVTVNPNFKTTELSSSISFLWGEGKLTDAFTAVVGDPTKYGAPAGTNVLELTPKKDATYTKLVLILDPKTSQVNESILYESSGNTNRFKFTSPKINSNIPASEFTFTPPKGVEVVKIQ